MTTIMIMMITAPPTPKMSIRFSEMKLPVAEVPVVVVEVVVVVVVVSAFTVTVTTSEELMPLAS